MHEASEDGTGMSIALGEYELLKRLGAGGMGEVFLARPLRREGVQDDRLLVIKTLLPHLADDEQTLTMFLDEARLAARLNHGNVCQIYELGDDDGTWFIAMEYVPGVDCAQLMRAGAAKGERCPPEIACRIVGDAATGLHYSHELTDGRGVPLGLVHRDVSPANILVTYEGGVKLIDFGVAKAVGRSHQTQVGQLKGKISYMSPEQARGDSVDKRSDIFALGIVLHELLTGKKLFDAEGQMEVLWAVTEADVPAPSSIDPSLPVALDEVVMRALAKEPGDRYATALEIRNGLERWAVTTGRGASPTEVGRWVRRLCGEETRLAQPNDATGGGQLSVAEITSIHTPREIDTPTGPVDECVAEGLTEPTARYSAFTDPVEDRDNTTSDFVTAPATELEDDLVHTAVSALPVGEERDAESAFDGSADTSLDHDREVPDVPRPPRVRDLREDASTGPAPRGRRIPAVALTLVGVAALAFVATRPDAPPPGAAAPPKEVRKPAEPRNDATPRSEATVRLTVVTDPPGATATLDGRPLGRTPLLERRVPANPSGVLQLNHPRAARRQEILDLSSNLEVTYMLTLNPVVVPITSRPIGAKVFDGDTQLGTTPLKWTAPADTDAPLRFVKRGYRTVEQSVRATEGVEIEVVLRRVRATGTKRPSRRRAPATTKTPTGPVIPTFGD